MKDNEFKDFLVNELKRHNPEAYLTQQQKLDLAFTRALENTTPERAASATEHKDSPNNPYNVYYKDHSDPDDGWM
jgi:hypothetical protein